MYNVSICLYLLRKGIKNILCGPGNWNRRLLKGSIILKLHGINTGYIFVMFSVDSLST